MILTCTKCGTEYAANLGPCFKCAAQRKALGPSDDTACSAVDAARTLARTPPTKNMTRAVAMSAMLDHCRPGEDVDQAASRILADALDRVTNDVKTLLDVAEINLLGSHGTVIRVREKYLPNTKDQPPSGSAVSDCSES